MISITRNIVPKPTWKPLGLLLVGGLLFGGTNASSVPAIIVGAGFILLSILFYYLAYGVIRLVELHGLPIKRKRRLATSLMGIFSSLVALQSIGELSPRDVLVLLPLVIVAYLYSFYSAGEPAKHLS